MKVDKTLSHAGTLTCGVPRGSILGPLLILLYINDIPQALSCDLLLYADDSYLIFQRKDINEIEKVLNEDFSDLCDWFLDNKSIYFGDNKTKCILFASKNKVKKANPLNIKYKDVNQTAFQCEVPWMYS